MLIIIIGLLFFPQLSKEVTYVTTQIPVFFNNIDAQIQIRLQEFKQLFSKKKLGTISLFNPHLYSVRDSQILFGNIKNSNFVINLKDNQITEEKDIPLWITQANITAQLIPASETNVEYVLNEKIIESVLIPDVISTNSSGDFDINGNQIYTKIIDIYSMFLAGIKNGNKVKIPIRKSGKKCQFGTDNCSTGFENYSETKNWFLVWSENHPFNQRQFKTNSLPNNLGYTNTNYSIYYSSKYNGTKKTNFPIINRFITILVIKFSNNSFFSTHYIMEYIHISLLIILSGLAVAVILLIIQRYSSNNTIESINNTTFTVQNEFMDKKITKSSGGDYYFGEEKKTQINYAKPFIKNKNRIKDLYLYSGFIYDMNVILDNDVVIYNFEYGNASKDLEYKEYIKKQSEYVKKNKSILKLSYNWRIIAADPNIMPTDTDTTLCNLKADASNIMYQNLIEKSISSVLEFKNNLISSQSVNVSVDQTVNVSEDQSINISEDQSVDVSVDQSVDVSEDQSVDVSVDQSISLPAKIYQYNNQIQPQIPSTSISKSKIPFEIAFPRLPYNSIFRGGLIIETKLLNFLQSSSNVLVNFCISAKVDNDLVGKYLEFWSGYHWYKMEPKLTTEFQKIRVPYPVYVYYDNNEDYILKKIRVRIKDITNTYYNNYLDNWIKTIRGNIFYKNPKLINYSKWKPIWGYLYISNQCKNNKCVVNCAPLLKNSYPVCEYNYNCQNSGQCCYEVSSSIYSTKYQCYFITDAGQGDEVPLWFSVNAKVNVLDVNNTHELAFKAIITSDINNTDGKFSSNIISFGKFPLLTDEHQIPDIKYHKKRLILYPEGSPSFDYENIKSLPKVYNFNSNNFKIETATL